MSQQISDERMREFIKQAKQAATIEDNTSGGMGLAPRAPRFESAVYEATLRMLIENEKKSLEGESDGICGVRSEDLGPHTSSDPRSQNLY